MHDQQGQLILDFSPSHRNTDPPTSAEAEAEITADGTRENQAKRVLRLVERHNGYTSAELAHIGDLDRHMVARRLPDLWQNGYVIKGAPRQCGISRRRAVTWWIGI